ncbi:MAG TPA: serine/threonine protein kinase [Cyanobacteria bacterium UBA11369]|nr:serine/threonine protein kinase [Cyanobacteria bacterium UBA11371]HBE32713.1 serine/threonine protein kinase [Cyanobacteria bacterium UBA11368]HBE49611.1 serine/threonine protein kinase [Cyanobacteria bacterium UBA11369]
MELYCTRPACPRPLNLFSDLDDPATLKRVPQKYCTTCGMPLILADRYMPLKLLGQGGFGAAFLARDRYTPTMRRCVVKLFQPSGNLTPQQLQTAQNLFEREAEVLEELGNQHAQIPDLFAFFQLTVPSLQPGKKEQFFYLVQELIDGENLEEEFTKNGKFSESQVLEILQQILPVLQFVHEHGSIHRDIKPSNIMRSRKGSLFLLDFGAVKQVTKVAGSSASSTGIYSMGYAPPEQMSGGQVYPSTDLYALAVTCLTLLTGKPPNELFDTYNNQWNWKTYAQVSPRLANILDRMLLTSPNQRYHSAQEVLAALTLPPPAPPVQTTAAVTPANPPPPAISVRPRFSLVEVLGAAAFSGFEGGLIAIALSSLPVTPGISMGLTVAIVGCLIYAQYRRILEGKDLPILIGISLTIVLIFRNALVPAWIITLFGNPIVGVLFVAGLTAAGAIAVTALFRLIYKILSLML